MVAVVFEDDATQDLLVQQIKVRDYDRAFAAAEDEKSLGAICTGLPKERIEQLTPESFEAVVVAVQEVNEKGFFACLRRRVKAMEDRLAKMPQETAKLMLDAGKTSSNSYPGLQPRA